MSQTPFDPTCMAQLLPIYYRKLFPHKLIHRWLSYGDEVYFGRREFSFTLEGDVYVRYKSYSDQLAMEKEICSLCPNKIDVGAVYNCKPSDRKMRMDFEPQERELVFDIDLTDYDDIRSCCSGGGICEKCWKFMIIAVKVLDRSLEEDFGFKHRLWVYSGRRGVHCWICDATARKLDQSGRGAVAEYLNVVVGGEGKSKKVSLGTTTTLHPSLQAALSIINKHFGSLLDAQGWLEDDTETGWSKIANLFPDVYGVRQSVDKIFRNTLEDKSSQEKWESIPDAIAKCIQEANAAQPSATKWSEAEKTLRNCLAEVSFQLAYPRLDIHVTKGLNHLLKIPFAIHPKTGNVSVPFDPRKVEQFSPFTVPRIDQLCNELAEVDPIESDINGVGVTRKPLDYKRTSMRESIGVFESFLAGMKK